MNDNIDFKSRMLTDKEFEELAEELRNLKPIIERRKATVR